MRTYLCVTDVTQINTLLLKGFPEVFRPQSGSQIYRYSITDAIGAIHQISVNSAFITNVSTILGQTSSRKSGINLCVSTSKRACLWMNRRPRILYIFRATQIRSLFIVFHIEDVPVVIAVVYKTFHRRVQKHNYSFVDDVFGFIHKHFSPTVISREILHCGLVVLCGWLRSPLHYLHCGRKLNIFTV